MSNVALTWAWKCHVGNAPAKAVLVYLADRAGEDGSAAYPKIDTIMRVTELKERTVRSALKLLQERGYIRRGDQRYARLGRNGRDRLPQYCQVVWDLNVLEDPATFDWYEDTHRTETDPTTMTPSPDPKAGEVPANEETKGLVVENVGNKPISSPAPHAVLENLAPADVTDLHEAHPQPCTTCTPSPAPHAVLPYKETTQQVNPPSEPFPSAPTGHLPASGATPPQRDEDNQPGDTAGDGADASCRLVRLLADLRRQAGLSAPRPSKADLRALNGLLHRLGEAGELDPAAVVAGTIRFAMSGAWWPKRIRTGRQLVAHFDELRDDMTLEARKTGGEPSTGAAEGPHVHTPDCEHVRRVIDSEDAGNIQPVQRLRAEFAPRIVVELNKRGDEEPGKAEYFAALLMRTLLTGQEAERKAQAAKEQAQREREKAAAKRELQAMRKANGGSMFAGHKPQGGA